MKEPLNKMIVQRYRDVHLPGIRPLVEVHRHECRGMGDARIDCGEGSGNNLPGLSQRFPG